MSFRRLGAGAIFAALAVLIVAASANADGMRRGSIKDGDAERRCTFSANAAVTSDYVFRGTSQSAGDPALQGGLDATCGMFYAGVWASSIDYGGNIANLEVDVYAGIKANTGRIAWDIGVIYYTYPDQNWGGSTMNYVELKVGASAEIWKGGTLGETIFYSPEYQGGTGRVWTAETSFSQVLPKVGMFTPTLGALLGYQHGSSDDYANATTSGWYFGNGDHHFLYWNAGLTLGFLEKWSIDLRYWDTSLSDNSGGSAFCTGSTFQCDQRFVATLKFTY